MYGYVMYHGQKSPKRGELVIPLIIALLNTSAVSPLVRSMTDDHQPIPDTYFDLFFNSRKLQDGCMY